MSDLCGMWMKPMIKLSILIHSYNIFMLIKLFFHLLVKTKKIKYVADIITLVYVAVKVH